MKNEIYTVLNKFYKCLLKFVSRYDYLIIVRILLNNEYLLLIISITSLIHLSEESDYLTLYL